MPVYVDILTEYPDSLVSKEAKRHGKFWCHMWADGKDISKMHQIALDIGLKRQWFQSHARVPHYDLTYSKRVLAVQEGAIRKDFADWCKENIMAKGKGKDES